jgi:hypothetical protein
MGSHEQPAHDAEPWPARWVRSVVRDALAARLYPTGGVQWEVVEAAIVAVEPMTTHITIDRSGAPVTISTPMRQPDDDPAERTGNPVPVEVVRLHVDSDRNALVAERVLHTAGVKVERDRSYDMFAPGHKGVRLLVQPGPESHGMWERDL